MGLIHQAQGSNEEVGPRETSLEITEGAPETRLHIDVVELSIVSDLDKY